MKKLLVLVLSILFTISSAMAEPIVELAAPRIQTQKTMSNGPDGISSGSTSSAQKAKSKKTKHKKKKVIKVKPPVLDYKKTTKQIENGYYDDADAAIQNVISKNSKDSNAPILWVVSQAKQGNLYGAQNKYNVLIKKYPKSSDLYYAKGIIDYKKGLTANALSEFKKAVELDKTNAKAYNALGVVSLNNENTTDAQNYFNKAYALDKTYSIAIDNLGTMDYAAGNLDSANKKFKQALTINPQNPTALYHLAQVAFKKQDCAGAIKYLDKAIALNRNIPAFYNLKGKCYAAAGNDASAIITLKKTIEMKPEYTLSYLDLAAIYAKRGDNEFAIEQLKTALSVNSNIPSAKLELANLSVQTEKYSQAIPIYTELVGTDEFRNAALIGLSNAYYGLAQQSANRSLLSSNKDLFAALECINKAIDANGNNLELHLAKLKLAKLTNQSDLTKVELQKILQSPNNDLITNLLKGEAYYTLNDYKNAQVSFDNAIKLAKTTDESLYLAEILIYQKQYDDAQKVLQKILKVDSRNPMALNGIDYIKKNKKIADKYFESAQTFLKAKNYTIAVEYLNRSITANPNNAQIRLILGEIYENQKEYQEALINYQAYVGLNPDAKNVKQINKKIQKLSNRL